MTHSLQAAAPLELDCDKEFSNLASAMKRSSGTVASVEANGKSAVEACDSIHMTSLSVVV